MLRAPRKKTAKTKTLTRKEAYDKANTKGLYIKLNKKTDADIIEALSECDNKQGLVKRLLRLNGWGDRDKLTGEDYIDESEEENETDN